MRRYMKMFYQQGLNLRFKIQLVSGHKQVIVQWVGYFALRAATGLGLILGIPYGPPQSPTRVINS